MTHSAELNQIPSEDSSAKEYLERLACLDLGYSVHRPDSGPIGDLLYPAELQGILRTIGLHIPDAAVHEFSTGAIDRPTLVQSAERIEQKPDLNFL